MQLVRPLHALGSTRTYRDFSPGNQWYITVSRSLFPVKFWLIQQGNSQCIPDGDDDSNHKYYNFDKIRPEEIVKLMIIVIIGL